MLSHSVSRRDAPAAEGAAGGAETSILRHLYLKIESLPRQARDKHWKSPKETTFPQGSGLGLQDCVAAVTYHAYTTHPEDTHKLTHTGPACGTAAVGGAAPCSSVEALARTLDKHVPGAFVFQGECDTTFCHASFAGEPIICQDRLRMNNGKL